MSQERPVPRFAPRIKAGWLFLSAGVVLIASVALIGPLDDLATIRYRRDRLAALEEASTDQLEAYLTFLEALDEQDPMLLKRLVAAQRNEIPQGDEPVGMIGTELDAHVDHWIQSSLPGARHVPPPVVRDSWLRRLSTGELRVWTLLAGAVIVFFGLLPESSESPGTVALADDGQTHEESIASDADVNDNIADEPVVHVASISPARGATGHLFDVGDRKNRRAAHATVCSRTQSTPV